MTDTVNPPAFPLYDHHMSGQQFLAECGMTLLDYMAAKAMQGMLADLPPTFYGTDWQTKLVASSYAFADAMLKERSKWINK